MKFVADISAREKIALGAILALAAILRMGWPGITEFKADEARLFALALDLAELKSWPACGIGSSVGLPNSPVSVYLYAAPLIFPFLRNPIGGVLWVGLLNTLAVGACWWLTRRYWGKNAALTAALLFAAAPWAVIYSRKIWAQNLLPLFTLGYLASGLLAFVEGRRRWIAAHLPLLALLAQIHLSAVSLAPLTALLLVLFRRRLDWRWLLGGIGLAALISTPYLGCGWAHAEAVAGAFDRAGTQPVPLSLDALALSWMMTTGAQIHSLAGAAAHRDFLASAPQVDPLLWLEGAAAFAGCAYSIWSSLAQKDNRNAEAGLVAALGVIAPILFFLPHATPVYPHYFIVQFPAPFIAAAGLIAALGNRLQNPWVRRGLAAAPIAVALAQVGVFSALLNFLAVHATPGGFGTPVAMQMNVVGGLEERLRQGEFDEVLFVSDGDNPAIHPAPAVFDVLLRGIPHRFVNGEAAAVLPARPAVVIIAPGDLPARAQYQAWAQNEESESFPLRLGEGEYLRLRLAPDKNISPPRAIEPQMLANGVTIVGYGWDGRATPGSEVSWQVWWRTGSPGADYHFFNHLVDESNARWGQEDGASFPSGQWREGDRVVSYFSLPIAPEAPPGPYWMRVGMYTYPDLANVPVLDRAGNPASDAVRLGPLVAP